MQRQDRNKLKVGSEKGKAGCHLLCDMNSQSVGALKHQAEERAPL